MLDVCDSGSTTNIVEAQTAEAAWWKKRPAEFKYMVAGGDIKEEEDGFWYQVSMLMIQGHIEHIWTISLRKVSKSVMQVNTSETERKFKLPSGVLDRPYGMDNYS